MGTWADVIATGNGGDGIEYRLVIEGAKYEFVTSLRMVGFCDETPAQIGKKRVLGLVREGLGFSEQCYLAGADQKVTINPVRISETSYPDLDAATEIFSALPDVVGWLAASLDDTATTVTLLSTADITAGDYLHLDTEVVYVESVDSATQITVTRAMWRTFAQAHNVSTASSTPAARSLDTAIDVWAGRRVWLYAHGSTELATSQTGRCVWRGTISGDPELEGGEATTWILNIESRQRQLEQDIAVGFDQPRGFRGIYYPGTAPFYVRLRRCATASASGATTDSEVTVTVVGWYESNTAFLAALVGALNGNSTLTSTWGLSFRAVEADGVWDLYVTIASTPRFISFVGGSFVDGWFTSYKLMEASYGSGRLAWDGITTVAASTEYIVPWGRETTADTAPSDVLRRVPRTQNVWSRYVRGTDSEIAANPSGRMYLDNVVGITGGASGDKVSVPQPPGEDGEDVPADVLTVDNVSTASGFIDAYGGDPITVEHPSGIIGAAGSLPQLAVSRVYGSAAGITLADLRDELVAAAPVSANDATTPWVLDDDLADWQDVVTEVAGGSSRLLARLYAFEKPQRLLDVLREEWKLHGLVPYLDSDFKIALRRLTIETAPVDSGLLVSGTTQIEGFGDLKSGSDGNVNVVEFFRGYDAHEDKNLLGSVRAEYIGPISKAKRRRVLEVRPKARAASLDDEASLGVSEALDLAQPVISMFGGRCIYYSVEVPYTFFDVHIGDVVLITNEELPFDGARTVHDPAAGMANQRAIVVGREWPLDDAAGRLTLLVLGLNVAGYSPTGRVSVATMGANDKVWTLTLSANHYAPSAASDVDYFEVGDSIRLIEWDSAAPTTREGTITGISGNDVAVTLTASWVGLGGATYNLKYGSTGASQASQQDYCPIGDNTLRVDFGSAAQARVFAP